MTELTTKQAKHLADLAGESGFSDVMLSLANAAYAAADEMQSSNYSEDRQLAGRLRSAADDLAELADYVGDYDTGAEL